MTTPLHQQLAETLLAQIRDGTIALGDRVPSEAELGNAYRLSRGTVRRALGRLEQLGMINRRAGAGTTVIASAPVFAYKPLAHGAADIGTLASQTRIADPDMGTVVADELLAQRIGTRPGTTWFRVQGMRVARARPEVPLCWSEHYIPGRADRSRLLGGEVNVDELAGQDVEQTISAALLEPVTARALGSEPLSAALVITRRHRERGRLVAVGIHTHPHDRYAITTRL
jgi:GntR family transcriptional regulator